MKMNRTFLELIKLETFEERFRYLSLKGSVGRATFGFDRYLNQKFYSSREWKQIRSYVITRDEGMDLGVDGYEIHSDILIHHMNPLRPEDIFNKSDIILDPMYLITTSHRTHNAIHFGDASLLPKPFVPRQPGDTLLWHRERI